MTEDNKANKANFKRKGFRVNITLQNVIIVILLIGYLVTFYTYKHDINQYTEIIENPKKLCSIYYGNLIEKITSPLESSETKENISKIFNEIIISGKDGK